MFQSTGESLRRSNRRVLVTGPRASGKTTFSVSASRFAGDTIRAVGDKRPAIECKDVAIFQGDNEGVMGAVDAGLIPGRVLDMCGADSWGAFQKLLVNGLKELRPLCIDGTIRVIIIDLALPARLIDRSISPTAQRDWKEVAIQGAELFSALSGLPGVLVIANAQIKATIGMIDPRRENVNQMAEDVAAAKAIGGERSTFTFDLPKGIATQWLDNCSFVFAREAKRIRTRDGKTSRSFKTLTQSSSRFEAKSRAESLLDPTEPGEKTLHALLKTAYGDNY